MKLHWQRMAAVSAFSLVLLSSARACTQNNHIRPSDHIADDVHQLMEEKNYKKLDELYARYSKGKAATADRVSALSPFFSGIGQTFNVACTKQARSEQEWRAHRDSLIAWRDASPGSTGPKLALALFEIDYAWLARGSGFASSVSDASHKLYQKRIASAKEQLDQLAGSAKNNPAWYGAMLQVAHAQGWPRKQFVALYDNAVKVDPYYTPIHYTYAAYHGERWHGSDEEEQAAIDRATKLTQKRLGQTMYTRLHWTRSKGGKMFETGFTSWPRMKTGFEDYLRIFSDTRTRNNYAIYACLADDKPTLRKQLALLGDQLDPKEWTNHQYAYCMAYAKLSGLDQTPTCHKAVDYDKYWCE